MFAPAIAFSADLGRLTVLSGVGEPLRAEIEILSVQPGEAGSLAARIPPPDVFWRANLEPSPLLDQLRTRVERRPKGRYVVSLSSTTPIESPFIQILVELDSATGRVVREYPFLLEQPRVSPTSPASPIATAPTVPERRVPETAADGTYVVRPGDTLASIARATRSPDATVEQTVVALYRANESVFIDGNMNRLPVGAVLALPPAGTATAIEPSDARRIILLQQAALPPPARGAGAAGTGEGPASAKPGGATAPSHPASGDQLRLTPSLEAAGHSADAARGDDIVALQRALAEAQERVALLQRDLEDVRSRVLALKGQQLGGVDQPERGRAELPARIPGNATAAERHSQRTSENRTLGDLVREHGAWLLAMFLVAFALWVVMPVKTTRAWLKRRRHRRREAEKTRFARVL
ncbi:MAG TPA: FimV/HubP family polar landmark protein [Burkholderiales bacterium]|nr:FimV/HubP family polar landmark protein [Burkholderiales bacterium]